VRRPRAQRKSAITALGLLIEQESAATLVAIATGTGAAGAAPAAVAVDPELANAATDALLEMTGLEANGHNPGRWAQWHRQNGNRNPAEWKAALVDARAARDRRMKLRVDATFDELRQLLKEQFIATPVDDRPARLLRFLRSPSPDVRRVGAGIAEEVSSKAVAGENTDEIRQRLIELVGDADPLVRLDVISALYSINIPPEQALDALLPQLAVETDSDVKAAIARKLSSVPGIRQVVELSMLLDDEAPEVVRDAAEAIRRRAAAVVQKDPKLAATVAKKLRATMDRLAGTAAYLEARRACGEALAELRDPVSLDFAQTLLDLNRREPPEIRGVALMILGELGPGASDVIVRAVDLERDPRVRERGIAALGHSRSVDQLAWLVQRMNARGEDAKVRERARQAYIDLLQSARPEKLANEAALRQQDDLSLRVEVLKVLIEQLKKEKKEEDVAAQQQSLGADLLRLNKPLEAVAPLRAALDYWRDRTAGPDVTGKLVSQLITAMLRSHQYTQLTALGQDLIAKAPPDEQKYYQGEIGSKIRGEVDALVKNAEDVPSSADREHAGTLIDAALKMNPPLDRFYRDRIEEQRKRLAAIPPPR
jgi:hypothetical protein